MYFFENLLFSPVTAVIICFLTTLEMTLRADMNLNSSSIILCVFQVLLNLRNYFWKCTATLLLGPVHP